MKKWRTFQPTPEAPAETAMPFKSAPAREAAVDVLPLYCGAHVGPRRARGVQRSGWEKLRFWAGGG